MGYFTYQLVQDSFLKFYSIRFFRVLNAFSADVLPLSPSTNPLHSAGAPPCCSMQPQVAGRHLHLQVHHSSCLSHLSQHVWSFNLLQSMSFGCENFPKNHYSSNLPTQNTSKIPLQTLTESTLPKLRPSAMKTPQSRPSCKKKRAAADVRRDSWMSPLSPWKKARWVSMFCIYHRKKWGKSYTQRFHYDMGFYFISTGALDGGTFQHLEGSSLPSYLKEIIDSTSVTVSLLDAALWLVISWP